MIDENLVMFEFNKKNIDLISENWDEIVNNKDIIVLQTEHKAKGLFKYANVDTIRTYEKWILINTKIFDSYLKRYRKDFSIVRNIIQMKQ